MSISHPTPIFLKYFKDTCHPHYQNFVKVLEKDLEGDVHALQNQIKDMHEVTFSHY